MAILNAPAVLTPATDLGIMAGMTRYLTDYKPAEPRHARTRRERQAREAVLKRRPKPVKWPKGWELPF